VSASLPLWMYRDPAQVVERIEAASCHGCAFVVRTVFQSQVVESCAQGRRFGRKCPLYVERK